MMKWGPGNFIPISITLPLSDPGCRSDCELFRECHKIKNIILSSGKLFFVLLLLNTARERMSIYY